MSFNDISVTFDTPAHPECASKAMRGRPVLRRMATTVFESPVGCIRKGCKCDITDYGCKITATPTTHIECPGTTIKGISGELASPRRFYRFIMAPEVELGDIDRRVLHQFMLECFESPFESPSDVRLQNKMKVKVELARNFRLKARDQLCMVPQKFWQKLNYQLGFYRVANACGYALDLQAAS